MLDGLTGVLGTTEQDGVGASGGTKSQLIEGEDLTTGLLDASASGSGETESGNRHLGDGEEAVVISDGANDNDGLLLVGLVALGESHEARKRDGRSVDARHEETAQDDLVEVGVGTAY